ncbi:MAG: CbiX/SirB N-terminal domain-containing protein [Candidatus Methylacidiphilales bacterium]|nr:CbiX/SirB N-terminal domain-containing protein [Candidatus Methylacidiphilales bacterium]
MMPDNVTTIPSAAPWELALPDLSQCALVLAGHGSTLNADSSAPTYQHSDTLRARGIFAEIHECFWKEEPNFRNVLREVESKRIYIVPNFISSGYFTEQVIPREFGLTGPVTRAGDGREIFYCQAVGLHPSMTEVLLARARSVVAASVAARGPGNEIEDPARTCALFICGHGTSLNDNSLKIVHEQADIIRAMGVYAECHACAMEQKPLVADWRALTSLPNVVVVPFFISDGLHSYEDIPVLLGTREQGGLPYTQADNPWTEGDRRLWYANAIGTEPLVADVILAQISHFHADHADYFNGTDADAHNDDAYTHAHARPESHAASAALA